MTARFSKRTRKSGHVRIGISGWTYSGWRGMFYPKSLPRRAEMDYAASRFQSIEINGSFYSLQRAASYRSWYERSPDDFVFAIKGSRYITHLKQLNELEQPLANFFAQGLLEFGSNWVVDPSTTARTPDRPIRYAVEIRHESFRVPEFVDLLREQDAALVVAGTAGKYPLIEELTTDFVYLRLHGSERMYAGSYSDAELDHWAARVRGWARGRRDVFVYFDNDEKTKAPFDARRLMERLGLVGGLPEPGTEDAMPP